MMILNRAPHPRAVVGLERLKLQGFEPHTATEAGGQEAIREFTETHLKDLAGHSFSATYVAVAMVLSMALFRWPTNLKELQELQSQSDFSC